MIKIIEMLAPAGHKCRSGRKLGGFRGVTIHNTGNAGRGADALAHARCLQGGGKDTAASWHYCVDEHRATRSIPESEAAWHAGDGGGPGNMQTVAIEICMNADGDLRKATENAAVLAADILARHGIGNAEGHLYQHHDWSGKNCPQMIRAGRPCNWPAFCGKVQGYLDGKEKDMTEAEAEKIIQEACGFEDQTIQFLKAYRYHEALLTKLAVAIQKGGAL